MRTNYSSIDQLEHSRLIRFELTGHEAEIRIKLGQFAIGRAHLATATDEANGFAAGAIVPEITRLAKMDDFETLLADPDTPDSCLVGFPDLGTIPNLKEIVARAEREVTGDFCPGKGDKYQLGNQSARLVDILHSTPNQVTTVIPDARVEHRTAEDTKRAVGLHYDNDPPFYKSAGNYPNSPRVDAGYSNFIFNRGPGDRLSVILPALSALAVSEALYPGDEDHIPTTKDVRRFFAEYNEFAESLPVVFTKIPPQKALRLPAGMALHDGSMIGCDKPSSLMIMMGRFSRSAFKGELL